MSYEPRILDIPCSCTLSNRDLNVLPTCQLCNGLGKVVDWDFDLEGNLQVLTGLTKLQQDILKIMLSYVGSNELYTQYGCNVDQSIGQKNLGSHTQTKIQSDIIEALNYLKQQQESLQQKFGILDPEEAIDTIDSVIVKPAGPTAYVVFVAFTTVASVSSSVSTTIGGVVDRATQQSIVNSILKRNAD